MLQLKVSVKDIPEKTEYILGFQAGVNKLQDESLIDNHELSDHRNGIITVDGVKKRLGSSLFGNSSGSRVFGGTPYYTSDGHSFIVREGGTSLIYYDTSNHVNNISGATMTTGLKTEFAMARDTLYVSNGTDALVKVALSGGIPAATTFVALTTPTGLVVTPAGTTGATPYSYRVSAFNATGETLACVSVAIANGNATLTSTNNNGLTWNAVAGAVGYNVYGRKSVANNGIGETKMATVTTNSYTDTGVDSPSQILIPPEGNGTGGQKGTMIIYALSRLFIAGDSNNPSRLYYSGGGTQIDDFSTAYTGGWVDVAKNDGDSITGIYFFQNTIIVFKHRTTWQFQFTSSGLPQLTLITPEVGCESYRTIKIVNNDLWFLAKKDGRARVYSLGFVQNYFNALRTTEQSLKISAGSYLDSVNLTYIGNASAFYFRNMYILAIANSGSSMNNRCYVYDTRFNAWIGYWDGVNPNCFFTWNDSSGSEELYYCDENSGYIIKMFSGTDDNGTAVAWKWVSKNFNQGYFDQYKIYRNPVFWFKDVSSGSITGYLITDGIFSSGAFNVSPLTSGIGAGFDIMGTFAAGDTLGASTTSAKSDQPMEVITTKNARAIKFELDDSNNSSDFKFLGMSYRWTLLEGKPLPAANRIRGI